MRTSELLSVIEESSRGPSSGMSSGEFVKGLLSKLKKLSKEKIISADNHNRFNDSYDTVFIRFVNLGPDQAKRAGGAERFNNRVVFSVKGFGRGEGDPPPTGKVKFSVASFSPVFQDAGIKIRGRSGKPEKIMDFIVKTLKELAQVEPSLREGVTREAGGGELLADEYEDETAHAVEVLEKRVKKLVDWLNRNTRIRWRIDGSVRPIRSLVFPKHVGMDGARASFASKFQNTWLSIEVYLSAVGDVVVVQYRGLGDNRHRKIGQFKAGFLKNPDELFGSIPFGSAIGVK